MSLCFVWCYEYIPCSPFPPLPVMIDTRKHVFLSPHIPWVKFPIGWWFCCGILLIPRGLYQSIFWRQSQSGVHSGTPVLNQPVKKGRHRLFLSCSCMFQDYWLWLNLIPEFWIYVWVGPCLDNLKSWQMYATCHFPSCSHSRWYPGNFVNCTGVWVSAMKQWHDGSGKSMKIADSSCD